jgi:hypothetical protein
MFRTVPQAEVSIPRLFSLNGERAWSVVFKPICLPWFYMTYLIDHRDDDTSQTVLVSSTEQLLAFPLEDGDFSVLEIQLVSPGWINGTGRWKMEPLTEIWRAREKESGQLADIFVLQNRSRYAVTALGPVESELDNPRLVARFN